MENVTGSDGNDIIVGDNSKNTLKGGDGDDSLGGGDGIDYIDGGTGTSDTVTYDYVASGESVTVDLATHTGYVDIDDQDTLANIENVYGSSGDDTIKAATGDVSNIFDGGNSAKYTVTATDSDTVSYENYTAGVTVALGETAAQTIVNSDTDTLLNIENLTGGKGADTLMGGNDTSSNKLDGFEGNDTFLMGLYDDTNDTVISGDDGADSIVGGDGIDTIDYSVISEDITVTLNESVDVSVSFETYATDTINTIENFTGGSGDDTITGDLSSNILKGGAGVDNIKGKTGLDVIYGDAGDDILSGGNDEDTLYGGADNDSIRGGIDDDTLYGGTGSDTLKGGVGDDTIYGGDASSTTTGDDWVSYEDAVDKLTVNLGDGDADTNGLTDTNGISVAIGADGYSKGVSGDEGQGTDSLFDIDNVVGSGQKDTITGNDNINTLYGNAGSDIFKASGANDGADTIDGYNGIAVDDSDADNSDTIDYSILGNTNQITVDLADSNADATVTVNGGDNELDGDDTIQGELGADHIYGDALDGTGSGNDTVSYAYLTTQKLIVNLDSSSAEVYGSTTDIDTISSIENVIGGTLSDTITGSSVDNILQGGLGGDDTFAGLGGDDTIYGGSYDGATHTDSGEDMADYSAENKISVTLGEGAIVTVDSDGDGSFTTGTEDKDTLYGIENIKGSDSGADTIVGDVNENTIYGMAGNDSLDGGAGADYIDGGAGADTIVGGVGADSLVGGDGADQFNVGTTALSEYSGDVIDGGDEIDTVDYSTIDTSGFSNGQGVEVVLAAGSPANVYFDGSATASHTLTNVENIIGTNLKDIITGDNQANTLTGMAGADTLKGNALSDVLYGGADSDELWGQDGDDSIEGGTMEKIHYKVKREMIHLQGMLEMILSLVVVLLFQVEW